LKRVLVVGTGLIGTSVGLAATAAGLEVLLEDVSRERVETAAGMGAGRPADGEPGADLVVVAAPPALTGQLCSTAISHDLGQIVTHTASVQTQPQEHLESSGVDASRYVGGHPIAGRETSGPAAAAADLFRDRPWVVCPAAATSPQAVEAVFELARFCGARPVVMTAGEHDRVLARLSHVPQLVASALAAAVTDLTDDEVGLAGPGLRDTTRIADSDPGLWTEIVAANPKAVADGLRATVEPLLRLAAELDAETPTASASPAVQELLERGRLGRALLPGKHGHRARAWATVGVVIPDEPGALADLFAAVAAHQVNLEDLRIEHAPGQPEGIAELAVAPAARDRLVAGLRASGWTVTTGTDAAL